MWLSRMAVRASKRQVNMGSLPPVLRRIVRASFAFGIACAFVASSQAQSLFPNPQIKSQFRPLYFKDDAIAFGDLDADGFSELIVAENGYSELAIYSNRDGLGFVETSSLPFATTSPLVLDWNLDGLLDVVCGGSGSSSGVWVFLGDGHGKLLPAMMNAGAPVVNKLVSADLDGDGDPDLIGNDIFSGRFLLVFGDGQGNIERIDPLPWPASVNLVQDLDVADVDGDGDVDFACSTFTLSALNVYLNDGQGHFAAPLSSTGLWYAYTLRFIDWTGDGKVDLLSVSDGLIRCSIGQGNGNFTSGQVMTVGSMVENLKLYDVDADGVLEALITDSATDTFGIVRRATPSGGFVAPVWAAVGRYPSGFAAGDFDSDGRVDVAVQNELSSTISILRGTGGGQVDLPGVVTLGIKPRDLAVGDVDRDGYDDVFVAGDEGMVVYRPDGVGGFAVSSALSIAGEVDCVELTDWNRDGFQDLVSAGERLRIHLGLASGTLAETTSVQIGSLPTCMSVLDFNGDGNPDVAVGKAQPAPVVEICLGDGGGGVRERWNVDPGGRPSALVHGDLDGDTFVDLIVACDSPAELAVVHGTAGGGIGLVRHIPLSIVPVRCLASDVDRDGDTDLIVGNYDGMTYPYVKRSLAVLWNDGQGNLSAPDRLPTGASPVGFALVDLDHDGWRELVCADTAANALGVLRGGASGFEQALLYGCGGNSSQPARPSLVRTGRFDSGFGVDAIVLDRNRKQFTVFPNLMPYVPEIYCTAKVTSQGCVPRIASLGQPRISLPTPFSINASDLPSGVHGLLMYSKSALDQLPFQGGTLCIRPPGVRIPTNDSGGAATCGGRFGFDFAAWIASGADPGLVAGQPLWAQYYFRDPGDAFGAGLTDAITVTVRP
jgi:hypothetical protein